MLTKQQVLDFVHESGLVFIDSQEFKEQAEECDRILEQVKIWIETHSDNQTANGRID